MAAVLSGIREFDRLSTSLGELRRNIHRLEKGLTAIPRRAVWGEKYIEKTVDKVLELNERNDNYDWYISVLTSYFNEVEHTPIVYRSFERFSGAISGTISLDKGPYHNSQRLISDVSYDELKRLALQRRSVRYYNDKIVDRCLIEKAVEIAKYSPSACNRQPYHFHVIDDPKLIREAAKLPNGTGTFHENIKMMIFLIGDLSNYGAERDRHLIYIDGSLAAMSFTFALETLGLSSCIINWGDIQVNDNKLTKFLSLNQWERCVLSISVGYASSDANIPYSAKKPVSTLIKYN
jgi:nitroreductase